MDCLRRNDALGDRARRSLQLRVAVCLLALAMSSVDLRLFAASEQHGQVMFGGLPVPGVTVTASQGGKHFAAITDQQGEYTFAGLDDGVWKFQVEMSGFAPQTQDIAIAADAPSPVWDLKLLPIEEITRGIPSANSESTQVTSAPPSEGDKAPEAVASPAPKSPSGFQRTAVNAASNAPPPPANNAGATANDTSSDLTQSAATGLLVNGSVNNGAASTFAQMAAFGNNRRGPGSLYNGGVGAIFDTSAWDASPFSLTGLRTPKPAYNDVQIVSALGGPLGIPRHLIRASNFFVAYQHAANDDATVQLGRVPTLLERTGNFSETLNASGQPTQIFNPATGLPFLGNVIPINPQAQALLSEYPVANVPATGLYNYQAPVLNSNQQNSVQARITKNFGFNQSLFGNLAYQRATTQATNLFGFQDSTNVSGLDSAVNWSRRFNRIFGAQFFSIHFKYEFSRLGTDLTPYFANRTNVSGDAGILGNDQEPLNWGPPNLIFSSGVAGLSEPEFKRTANQTQAFSYDSLWSRGRHSVAFGGDIRRQQFNIFSQQDARGTFAFTGSATQAVANGLPVAGTGSDLADFLLGIPDTASIDFGNSDKYLRGWIYDAFINDDWRINSGLTLNVGLRWEYAEPLRELHNRLANLDIGPVFTSAATVTAGNPTGSRYRPGLSQFSAAPGLSRDRTACRRRLASATRISAGDSRGLRGLRQHISVSIGCDATSGAAAV